MATVIRETTIEAATEAVWAKVRDWGALDRTVPGFVTACATLPGPARHVTFANGLELTEQIVACDDEARRLVWHIAGQGFDHHNGAITVTAEGDGARVTWTADVLPDGLAETLGPLMQAGLAAMRQGFSG